MIAAGDVFRRSPNIVARKIMDEVILVPVEGDVLSTQCIYSTNEVGGSIWDLIDGQRSVREIARRLAAEYEVEEETALHDAAELLEALREKECVIGPL